MVSAGVVAAGVVTAGVVASPSPPLQDTALMQTERSISIASDRVKIFFIIIYSFHKIDHLNYTTFLQIVNPILKLLSFSR
ncbi:MAG: hypothetical protein IKJ80_07165 [Clostridia bacterium]|nr:hypothetical protein [Clostridia bacterium]